MMLAVELYLLLVLANGAPVIAARLLKQRWEWPIDGGRLWRDGRPVFGASKTWRGLVTGALSCAAGSALMALGAGFGLVFGVLGLLGDLISSFLKRRRGLASSARALGLDQLPEAALPMGFALLWLPLGWLEALAVVALFALSNIVFSPLLYRLGIRRQPH